MVEKPSQIQKIGSRKTEIKMMLVAPPGFGKTVFGASGDRVLFLSVDPEGTESAWYMGREADEWPAPTLQDVTECYTWLLQGGHKEYDWFIVDTVGFVQKNIMRAAIQNGVDRNPKRDPLVPSLEDHFKSQLGIEDFVRRVNELPMNILWLAHQERNENDDGEVYFAPAIHGQKGEVAQTIAGLMRIIAYGEQVEDEDEDVNIRRFWFTKYGPFRGKDRTNSMGPYRDNLTLKEVEQIVQNKKEKVLRAKQSKSKPTTAKPVARAKRAATTRRK